MSLQQVSTLMPIRDGASHVARAVADLVAVMGPDDELLAVDDGSADATPQILAEWSGRDPRIRVVTASGLGLVGALNLGISEASHEWIARADADDRYPRDRLTLQRGALTNDVALVTGDYRLIPSIGGATYLPCALGHPFVALSLINPQRIPHPGVVFSRDAVIAAGGYRKEDFPAEDLGLWLRLAAEGDFVGVPGVVVDWTMAPGSVSHSRQAEQRSATQRLLAAWRPAFLDQVDDAAVSRELARYESSSHAQERALLLLRDLRAWRQRGERLPGEAQILGSSARHPVSTLGAGWRLTLEARQRRQARSQIVASPKED
jgi:glycosyltransferase involved in cell wall biosynthesis